MCQISSTQPCVSMTFCYLESEKLRCTLSVTYHECFQKIFRTKFECELFCYFFHFCCLKMNSFLAIAGVSRGRKSMMRAIHLVFSFDQEASCIADLPLLLILRWTFQSADFKLIFSFALFSMSTGVCLWMTARSRHFRIQVDVRRLISHAIILLF